MFETAQAVAAIERVKGALDRKSEGPLSCYFISEGMIHAQGDGILAAAPFPWAGSAYIVGADLEAVLNKSPPKILMTENDGSVTMSSGRFRASVKTMRDGWLAEPPSDASAIELDADTLAKMRAMEPFINDKATPPWTNALIVQKGRFVAVGFEATVIATTKTIDFGTDALVPLRALALVNKSKVAPLLMRVDDKIAAWWWPDGGYIKTQLIVGTIPRTTITLADRADAIGDIPEIAEDWREAFDRVSSFADDVVSFYHDRIVGTSGEATIEDGADSILPKSVEQTNWRAKNIRTVIAASDRFDMTAEPALWSGKLLRGLVAGIR